MARHGVLRGPGDPPLVAPGNPGQVAAWRSTVEFSAGFFSGLDDRPVPVDLRAVKALRAPMALDIYTWLTYRMSYLRKPTRIRWEALRLQFGANYARARNFKGAFLRHPRTVLTLYPAARLESHPSSLLLKPQPSARVEHDSRLISRLLTPSHRGRHGGCGNHPVFHK